MKRLKIFLTVVTIALAVGLFGLSRYDRFFPFGRMWETPGIRPHEAVLPVTGDDSVPFFSPEAVFRVADGNTLVSPLAEESADQQVMKGKQGYLTYCAQCHGGFHDGNGTVGQSFSPLPADLNSPVVQDLPQGVMFQRISYGNPPNGRQPALASTIPAADRWRIVAYVKSLGKTSVFPP